MRHLLAFLVLLPVLAFAAPDGGTRATVAATPSAVATPAATVAATVAATLPPVAVTPPSSPNDIAQGLVSAFHVRNWSLVVAFLLIGIVAFLRSAAPKVHGRLGAWLNTQRGGTTLVLTCGVLGAIGTSLYSGAHISSQVIIAGVTVGVLASGGWNTLWDLFAPNDNKANLDGPVPVITPSPTPPADPPKAA